MGLGKTVSNGWQEFKAFAFKGNMIDLAVAVVIGAAFSGVINSLVSDVIMPGIITVTTAVKEAKDAATNVVAAPPTTTPTSQPQASDEEKADAAKLLASFNADIGQSKTPLVQATADVDKLKAMKGMPKEIQDQIDKASTDLQFVQQATGTGAAAPAPAPPAPAPGKPEVVNLDWKIGQINVGRFIGSLVNFILIAFAVFLVIVKLLGNVMKRVGGTPKPSEPTTKECPYCLSVIPIKAVKCANCTADLPNANGAPVSA